MYLCSELKIKTMTQEVINLFQEGLSVSKIAKQLNSYPAKVASILNENGFTTDKRSTIDQVVSVVDAVNEGKTYAEAAKIAGVTFQKVITICKNNGIYKQVKTEVTPELIQKCIEMYTEGVASTKISKELGISKHLVLKSIKDLPKKEKSFYNTYSCNYSFFENIDNEAKAYFLGLFYADGSNDENKKVISIGFAEKDKELLDQFMDAIESNHKIRIRDDKRTPNTQPFYSIAINNPSLSNDLANYGCIQNKTHQLDKLPAINESLIRHFIRGYFDGDGSVWISDHARGTGLSMSITGNKPFILDIQNFLIENLDITSPQFYIRHKSRNNQIGDIRYAHANAAKILEWLYNDCQYYSTRKKLIYQNSQEETCN